MIERAKRYVGSGVASRRFARAVDILDAQVAAIQARGLGTSATTNLQHSGR
jgi:hypothetical protein